MLDVNTDKLIQTENNTWQTDLSAEGTPRRQDINFETTTFGQTDRQS
jgi:hypothetical protein